ncbi:MAG: PLP-dependent transferase [Limisphaerales bacterium]
MTSYPLLYAPLWDASTLGRPLPDTPHAVSVSLPRWRDVVAYEEKNPEVTAKMALGYPRFVIHPLVRELAGQLGDGQPCLPFPSARAAETAAAYVRKASGAVARVVPGKGVFGVVTTDAGAQALKDFWQHTGLIVSSRQAEAALAGRADLAVAPDLRASLRRQLAAFYHCEPDDIFLAPTGMAAQFAALRACQARRPGQRTVQFGFPYVDTLKLQQKLGAGAHLLHDLEHLETGLRSILADENLAAAFGEIPGNPLLGSADVRRISPLLKQHGIPLVADDVVASPVNVDLGRYADLTATSLTKYVAGTCDVMGGAVICNPRSPLHAELKAILQSQHEELLWGADAVVLEDRARTFPHRMHRHNANGLFIAEKLRAHPRVERVWYPKWEFREAYEAVRRPQGGWGSLVTFLPRDAAVTAPRVFDALRVCKGPSLGTVFTLACPFVLLAHYTELDWAEACGVPRHLIRLSVGLEEPEELWTRIEAALNAGG